MSELGYFTDDSMVRRVHRETAVALAGPRALLMQATHPVAFAGFFAHTGALDEPYERLNRTAAVMDTITFGPRVTADRMTRRVRTMHSRVRGELGTAAGRFPAGTPYAADDPELLLWVLTTLADSSMVVYERYVRPLSRDERNDYWRDYRQIGRLFALRDEEMPEAIEDFDAYIGAMLEGDDLHVTPEARELAIEIVMRPPSHCWRGRCSSWPTRPRSVSYRSASGASTASGGTRHAGSPCAAAPSTPAACSSRCCLGVCATCRAPAPRRRAGEEERNGVGRGGEGAGGGGEGSLARSFPSFVAPFAP